MNERYGQIMYGQIMYGQIMICPYGPNGPKPPACDAKIAALDREIALLDELFQALLEELMTGRVRVFVEAGEAA
ncbi:MAG: hypothetical protein J5I90_13880 [Caldilineales bacterium]|nr:hypothetical protein [Caldilineales bacterium]